MVNLSKEKEAMLRTDRIAQRSYDRLRRKGTSVIIRDDGRTYDIIWPKHCFMHLCGFNYFTDKVKTRRASSAQFYDDLQHGKVSSSRVDYTNSRKTTLEKSQVICEAMDIHTATHIVESGNSRVLIYFGQNRWCIGLDRVESEYVPTSLRKESILSRNVIKTGTFAHTIARID